MKKGIISICLALSILFSTTNFVLANSFEPIDIPEEIPSQTEIEVSQKNTATGTVESGTISNIDYFQLMMNQSASGCNC